MLPAAYRVTLGGNHRANVCDVPHGLTTAIQVKLKIALIGGTTNGLIFSSVPNDF
jgi:hypothetical protein